MRTARVKICGITSIADARAAVQAGADALGFVFAHSPRKVSPAQAKRIIAALPPFISAVGVFVDEETEAVARIVSFCRLTHIQFHGAEAPERCIPFAGRVIKAIRIKDDKSLRGLGRYRVAAFLLDSHVTGQAGGTGKTFRWEIAAELGTKTSVPIILSGGLNSQNVAKAIKAVKPYAVDVSSGVEASPGRKDAGLVRKFIRTVRQTLIED